MAIETSVSCSSNIHSGGGQTITANLYAKQESQSVDNNTSTIYYTFSAVRGSMGFNGTERYHGGKIQILINGSVAREEWIPLTKIPNYGIGKTEVSGSGRVNVSHNGDGSKSCSVQVKIIQGSDDVGHITWYWEGSQSGVAYLELSTIPRASNPSLSAGEATLGDGITINTNRKSSSFTHSLWWSCGSSGWKDIVGNVGDSYTWTIPRVIANYITSSTSATVTIICRTYNNGTQVGNDQYTSFTGKVPDDIVPSISNFSVWEAVSNVSSKFGVYLKGASKLGISFNEAGSYGSWITSRKINANNQTSWQTSMTTDYLYSSGNMIVEAIVTDSRGRNVSKRYQITVYDYGTPWVSSFKGIRCNSDGTANDGGNYIKLQFEAGVYSVSNKNTAQYQLGYRIADSGSYSWKTLDITSLSYKNTTGVISGLTFSEEHSYDLILWVGDKLGNEARRPDTLATEFRLMDFYKDGMGMAIGKVAEQGNLFDVGLNSKFRKGIYADNGICAGDFTYYGAPIYGASGSNMWVHLGTWTSGGDAHNCLITVLTGAGYNGGSSQNTKIEISIKDGWQSSLSASEAFGATYSILENYYDSVKVKILASAHNICDVWVYMPWGYFNGEYTFQGFGAWKHVATCQSAEPTGNEQNCAEKPVLTKGNFLGIMRDYLYPVGAIYITYNNNNPQNFLGGTWEWFGQGRVLLGVGSGDDTHYFNENTMGGLYEDASLRATIGAFGNDIYTLGYVPSGKVKGVGYGYGLHVPTAEKDIPESKINHATLVKRENGENPSLVQPYITSYFWRRTA